MTVNLLGGKEGGAGSGAGGVGEGSPGREDGLLSSSSLVSSLLNADRKKPLP